MIRPTNSKASLTEAASSAAPMPKITLPIAMPRTRPSRSARWPAKNDAVAAGRRIDDTTSPCKVEERWPMLAMNWGIVVIGPMHPVSSLKGCSFEQGYSFVSVLTHPKRQPPKAMSTDARAYLGGWRRSIRYEVIVIVGNELGPILWIVTEGGGNL